MAVQRNPRSETRREPEELRPKCPECGAKIQFKYYECDACGHKMTPAEMDAVQLANMLEFYEENRRQVQPYEVRVWYERPEGVIGTPSHWATAAYATSRNQACIIADALHRQRGGFYEVWCLDPLHKHLGDYQRYDSIPDPNSVVPCTCEHCQMAQRV